MSALLPPPDDQAQSKLDRIIRMTSGRPAGVGGQPIAPPPDPETDPEMYRIYRLANDPAGPPDVSP